MTEPVAGAVVRIGVDLGGTKIEAIALAPSGDTLLRRRAPAPRDDYDATLQAIVDLVLAVEREVGSRATVGLGTPGAISPATGRVKNSNSIWLNDRPLADDLTARLDRPLRFDNDANCFALSEATDGGAAGARVVFGVILGTGTGGGLVVDGRPLIGAERDRRRVGAQPAALAATRRASRPGVLLWPPGLPGNVPLRPRALP